MARLAVTAMLRRLVFVFFTCFHPEDKEMLRPTGVGVTPDQARNLGLTDSFESTKRLSIAILLTSSAVDNALLKASSSPQSLISSGVLYTPNEINTNSHMALLQLIL